MLLLKTDGCLITYKKIFSFFFCKYFFLEFILMHFYALIILKKSGFAFNHSFTINQTPILKQLEVTRYFYRVLSQYWFFNQSIQFRYCRIVTVTKWRIVTITCWSTPTETCLATEDSIGHRTEENIYRDTESVDLREKLCYLYHVIISFNKFWYVNWNIFLIKNNYNRNRI